MASKTRDAKAVNAALEINATGWFEREAISRARSGDRDAALELINIAISGLLARSLDAQVGDYLADCLMVAHSALAKDEGDAGKVLATAFNLSKVAHRTVDERIAGRALDIAIWVHMAIKECGLTTSAAKAAASDLFGVENINRELRKEGKVIQYNSAFYRSYFAEIKRPLPPRQ